ncbi:hypothetical protein HS088_TW22G01255 [Tripterygium wilfordii]|uniref:Hyccin n=1 Tax=Tripterygium wilfordii TaxID=458696 RepID=A0A7J7C069_TRIWF|nr:uncharacterized protein LOC119992086 [Tripterygium wilfordii]KAF5727559.1 hypothetical protein HS088_TW22G01255 [Tripterygium wilfordii]
MSDDTTTSETTATTFESPPSDSLSKPQLAIQSLSSILTTIPPSLSTTQNPSRSLLHDPDVSSQISTLLRLPNSGAGENNLCRWFYDTFQSTDPDLQLVVLRFLPIIAGLYLSRVSHRKPLAGFEAILLALYAHETTTRGDQPVTVNIPDLSNPSIYHESKAPVKNNSTGLNLTVISPILERYGTVRSTRRAGIVGVALELYYSKIFLMPVESKIDFCEFCEIWAGQDGEMYKEDSADDCENEDVEKEKKGKEKKGGRIPLPWELLQPILRILGHCLLGPNKDKALFGAASGACRSLYARCLHDINPKAILAIGSLLRLGKIAMDDKSTVDYTEIPLADVITI